MKTITLTKNNVDLIITMLSETLGTKYIVETEYGTAVVTARAYPNETALVISCEDGIDEVTEIGVGLDMLAHGYDQDLGRIPSVDEFFNMNPSSSIHTYLNVFDHYDKLVYGCADMENSDSIDIDLYQTLVSIGKPIMTTFPDGYKAIIYPRNKYLYHTDGNRILPWIQLSPENIDEVKQILKRLANRTVLIQSGEQRLTVDVAWVKQDDGFAELQHLNKLYLRVHFDNSFDAVLMGAEVLDYPIDDLYRLAYQFNPYSTPTLAEFFELIGSRNPQMYIDLYSGSQEFECTEINMADSNGFKYLTDPEPDHLYRLVDPHTNYVSWGMLMDSELGKPRVRTLDNGKQAIYLMNKVYNYAGLFVGVSHAV